MLVLTRRIGERIAIGESIEVDVLGIRGQQVQLGVAAPKNIEIWRSEIQHRGTIRDEYNAVTETSAADTNPIGGPSGEILDHVLDRSRELYHTILSCLLAVEFDESPRSEASAGMSSLSFEHAFAVQVLMGSGCPTSAISVVRLQFEAVTRAMWLLYAANDDQVRLVLQELTAQTANSASRLPTVSPMIDEIGRQVGVRAPEAAHQMLVRFKETSLKALNSFVHAGVHPLQRHVEGVPDALACQVLKNSNGLFTMAGMTLAVLTGDMSITKSISAMQFAFSDCLPDLVA